MATEKLFWKDAYAREFDARVVSVDVSNVILDKTCFYPRGGGQVGDTGELNGIRVLNTTKDENENILHALERAPDFSVDSVVHGKIDWEKRYSTMKLHSSAHIVYYLMKEVFGEECGIASPGIVDEKKDRSDYLFTAPLDKEKLALVETKANEILREAREIKTWDEEGKRYWEMAPFSRMMCAGTHVKNSSEIGGIAVARGKKPGAGKERIEISLR